MKVYTPSAVEKSYTTKQLNSLNIFVVFLCFLMLFVIGLLTFFALFAISHLGASWVNLLCSLFFFVVVVPFMIYSIGQGGKKSENN